MINNYKMLLVLVMLLVTFSSCYKDAELSEVMKEIFYLRNGGSDMPVFVRGNGLSKKFIVLLHGGPGDTSTDYMVQNFSKQLQKHYAFAFWDQRQQGNSHGHLNKEEVTLAKIVEDTYFLLQALKTRYGTDIEIYLMGHSWGGTVGTAFLQTEDYQNEVAGFIEVSGGFDFPRINKEVIKMMQTIGEAEINKGNRVSEWQEIIDYANSLNPESVSTSETLELNSYSGTIEREGYLDDAYKIPSAESITIETANESHDISVLMNVISIFVQQNLIDELVQTSLTENLYKIIVPTLLIWGKYDFKVPPALGQLTYDNISSTDKTFIIYEHAGHNSMKYDPDRFVNDVIEFIEN